MIENYNKNKSLEINSLANPKIKQVVRLLKSSDDRQREKVIIVDGLREIQEAIKAGYKIEEFFYCLDFLKNVGRINDKKKYEVNSKLEIRDEDGDDKNFAIRKVSNLAKINYKLNKKVFEKISYKKNPDGFLAVVSARFKTLDKIRIHKNPLVLVLESVEKPGNLGAIIRTAYASGVDLIILNDQKTDLYSPNVIRSSTGFIFSMPIVMATKEEAVRWLNKNNIDIFVTTLIDSQDHFSVNLKKSTALVFGTEAFGLSDFWLKNNFKKVKIPMRPGVDSLNVSVSVGIIIYEAIRQRGALNI